MMVEIANCMRPHPRQVRQNQKGVGLLFLAALVMVAAFPLLLPESLGWALLSPWYQSW
jgi:hypothetical protein